MKKLILSSIIILSFLFSCKKQNVSPPVSNQTPTTNTPSVPGDTITPYHSSGCCDSNYIYTGQLDTAIKLIPNIVTANGDGVNDALGFNTNSPITQNLTLEIKDSLGVLVYYQDNYATVGGTYFVGFQNTNNAFYYDQGRAWNDMIGVFDAKLSSSTGSVEFKLCVSKKHCAYNICSSCKFIDIHDPYIKK